MCIYDELFFEREKLLLVIAVLYAGKRGYDEFESAIINKINDKRRDCCLSESEMAKVLQKINMPNIMIEESLNKIKKGIDCKN